MLCKKSWLVRSRRLAISLVRFSFRFVFFCLSTKKKNCYKLSIDRIKMLALARSLKDQSRNKPWLFDFCSPAEEQTRQLKQKKRIVFRRGNGRKILDGYLSMQVPRPSNVKGTENYLNNAYNAQKQKLLTSPKNICTHQPVCLKRFNAHLRSFCILLCVSTMYDFRSLWWIVVPPWLACDQALSAVTDLWSIVEICTWYDFIPTVISLSCRDAHLVTREARKRLDTEIVTMKVRKKYLKTY